MKKGIVFAVLCGVIILLVIAFYATQMLEFTVTRIAHMGDSSMDVYVTACNPLFVPLTVNGFQADMNYSGNTFGKFVVEPNSLLLHSKDGIDGRMVFTNFDSMKNFVDWIVGKVNVTTFSSTVWAHTKIMGIIPFSYQKTYNFPQFSSSFLQSKGWPCQINDAIGADIEQQLPLIQTRLSAAKLLYSEQVPQNNTTQLNGR